jgi:DNA-binding NtrC family response regulator
LERAVILCDGGLINVEHLPTAMDTTAEPPSVATATTHVTAGQPSEGFVLPPGGIDLEAVERDLVIKALERAGENKSKAARLLGLTRAQLYSRIEKYGL